MENETYIPLEQHEIDEAIAVAIRDFRGYGPTLEAAIGAIYVGRAFGWEILYLMHNRSTLKRFEEILGNKISFKERLPANTELAQRNYAWVWANKFKSFWKIIRGEVKAENRTELRKDPVQESELIGTP